MSDIKNLVKWDVVNSFKELDPWYVKQIKKVTKISGALALLVFAREV